MVQAFKIFSMAVNFVLLDIAIWTSIVLVLCMALLQLSITLGAPLGEYVLGGTHKVLPTKMKFLSGFLSCLWFVVGISYLQEADIINPIISGASANMLLIIYTIFLGIAIIWNGFVTKSKKEKYVMTPLTTIGFICSMFFLLNS